MEIADVVRKLVGPIDPIGETLTDEKRYENLLQLIKLTDELITDVARVRICRYSHQASIKKAGERAYRAMTDDFGIPQ